MKHGINTREIVHKSNRAFIFLYAWEYGDFGI